MMQIYIYIYIYIYIKLHPVQTMPPESYTYGLPRELAERHGLRRYGFHGSSYKYVKQVRARTRTQSNRHQYAHARL